MSDSHLGGAARARAEDRIWLTGLIAAVFTPMSARGAVEPDVVPGVVEFLIAQGVDGLFACGSTGESPSLTLDERRIVAEAYHSAARGRVPLVVHVGHNSLDDSRMLAAHAETIGADAIAVVAPSYFKVASVGTLIDCLARVAEAAPSTPLYYYHIPSLTGIDLKMLDLLESAGDRLPTFAGIKFSSVALDELLRCVRFDDERFNILFGCDEMLLAGLVMGAAGAVGSTYNFLAPLYRRVIDAHVDGDQVAARKHQLAATRIVHAILEHGGNNAIKAAMGILGVDCGPTRLPLQPLDAKALDALRSRLTGFAPPTGGARPGAKPTATHDMKGITP